MIASVAAAAALAFVPADPPAHRADCVAAAGDVVAVTRYLPRSTLIEVSSASGPWERTLGAPVRGFGSCPAAAAAPDGTAAVAANGWLSVRRPGGGFGAPVRLGAATSEPELAVASGGWAVAAWVADGRLTAVIVAPTGAVTRKVLERGTSLRFVHSARAAIAPGGEAVVVWSQSRREGGLVRRIARASGGAWGAAADLPGAAGLRLGAAGLALATSPGGRVLVAWAAEDGVWVMVDGEAPQLVVPGAGWSALAAALADDGSAALSYSVDEVFVLGRRASGPWSAPRQVSHRGLGRLPDLVQSEATPALRSVVAADGRGVVAWPSASRTGRGALVTVAGHAGGGWEAARRVSSPTRSVPWFSLSLDASGEPRLLWAEGRLRGARLGSAPVADVTAPAVSARLPARAPATRTGRVRFAIPVRCSEACDVRLELAGNGEAATLRELAAGRRATLRVAALPGFAQSLLGRVGEHRLKLRLEVADRAGNVVGRTAVVRVRILFRPLRSFKVGPDHDFQMFSKAGNRAVGRLVNALVEAIASGASARELSVLHEDGVIAIDDAGYGEVSDTAVRDAIYDALWVPLTRARLDPEDVLLPR